MVMYFEYSCNEDWFHLGCLNLGKYRLEEDDFDEFICSDCIRTKNMFDEIFNKYDKMAKTSFNKNNNTSTRIRIETGFITEGELLKTFPIYL